MTKKRVDSDVIVKQDQQEDSALQCIDPSHVLSGRENVYSHDELALRGYDVAVVID